MLFNLRKYNAFQQLFLQKLVSKLLNAGLIYSNPSALWAYVPLVVARTGPDGWGFTVDPCPISYLTYTQAFPVLVLEIELQKPSGPNTIVSPI